MFVSNNFGGMIQEMCLSKEDQELLALIQRELTTYIDNMEEAKLVTLLAMDVCCPLS